MPKVKDRNGEEFVSKQGDKVKIVNYKNAHDLDLLYEDGHIQHCHNYRFRESVVNKNRPSVFGVGCLGIGDYDTHHISYYTWQHMLERCYRNDGKYSITYDDCYVCEEWLNFQNFARWYDANYYKINEDLEVDKDIKCKGNKVYSPDFCLLVPQNINKLFVKQQNKRGSLPIGVTINNRDNKLEVRCRNPLDGKKHFLGYFELNDIDNAFIAYKEYKEVVIKEVAKHYKDDIPVELYEAMMNYKVERSD
jgi:hypothetical protein